jgi:RimJ/RimL family protein N-acetyltransferase
MRAERPSSCLRNSANCPRPATEGDPCLQFDLPTRIQTERLILRRYEAADVTALDGDAIQSIDHIGRFMPNARAELLGDRVALIAEARRAFDACEQFAYGIFLPDGSYVGNCGAHWVDDAELNIGYWVLLDHLRKGYASEAVRAITAAGFAVGVQRFVLNCNPANVASIGVARSTGFTYLTTAQRVESDGVEFEEMTWELERDGVQPLGDPVGDSSQAVW